MKVHSISIHDEFQLQAGALTLGNFDGVHLGHQKIVNQVTNLAKTLHLPSLVIGFSPHPMKILHPQRVLQKLYPQSDLVRQMEGLGVDHFVLYNFSEEMASLSAEDFLKQQIISRFSPKHIIVGYDFVFGKNREGNFDLLKTYESKYGYKVHEVSELILDRQPVSSSRIRKCLLEGDVISARKMLGRAYSFTGVVQSGDGRGRGIGIPTANLSLAEDFILAKGVYVTTTLVDGKECPSITNVGVKPTFSESLHRMTLETHIFDADLDLLGKSIEVKFFLKLRSEKKFESVALLVEQIKKDILEAREFFSEPNKMG